MPDKFEGKGGIGERAFQLDGMAEVMARMAAKRYTLSEYPARP
jgi:hypothetical protein